MPGSLDPLRRELDQRVRITGRRTADEWERSLQDTSPIDTGNMRNNTRARDRVVSRGVEVTAEVDAEYAEMVASGTRPHEIRPRARTTPSGRPPMLKFQVGGRTVFARKVNHPGTRPNDWWDVSIRRLPDMIQRIWRGLR